MPVHPVIFVIDDDARVAAALHDDLARRFGRDFRLIAETSARSGLAAVRELAGADAPVALVIAGHDMAEMPGVPGGQRVPGRVGQGPASRLRPVPCHRTARRARHA